MLYGLRLPGTGRFTLFPGAPLPSHHLIFNTIGDADLCKPALRTARRLVKRTAMPVLNHPEAVMKTGRVANVRRLKDLPGVVTATADPPEVVLRVAVRDPRKAAVERFSKEFSPLVTSGFPGTTGYTTGRPPVREVFAYWPCLLAKDALEPKVEFL